MPPVIQARVSLFPPLPLMPLLEISFDLFFPLCADGCRAGDKSRTQLFLIVFKQKGIDLIDIINFLFQTVSHDPIPLGAVGEGIVCALQQVDGLILRQMQPHRKGKYGLLFGVVVPVALNFGEMLPGDVGLHQ